MMLMTIVLLGIKVICATYTNFKLRLRARIAHTHVKFPASAIEFYATTTRYSVWVIELFKFFLLCILGKHLPSSNIVI